VLLWQRHGVPVTLHIIYIDKKTQRQI